MKIPSQTLFAALLAVGLTSSAPGATTMEGDEAYTYHAPSRHQVDAYLGLSVKSGVEWAYTYGLEYKYSLYPRLGVGAYYGFSSGDYNAEGGGIPVTFGVTEEFKLRAAIGVERELFGEDKMLFRLGGQYDFLFGPCNVSPVAWIDFVNHQEILFFGLMAGVSF